MSKKMIKRSLALGALMAFVITGSATAAELGPVGYQKDVFDSVAKSVTTENKGFLVKYTGESEESIVVSSESGKTTYSYTLNTVDSNYKAFTVFGQSYKDHGKNVTFNDVVDIDLNTNSARNFTGQGNVNGISIYDETLTFANDLTVDVHSTNNANGSAISVTGINAWGYKSTDEHAPVINLKGNTTVNVSTTDTSDGTFYDGDSTDGKNANTNPLYNLPGTVTGVSVQPGATLNLDKGKLLDVTATSKGKIEGEYDEAATATAMNFNGGTANLNGSVNFTAKAEGGKAFGVYANTSGYTDTTKEFSGAVDANFNGDTTINVIGGERAVGVYAEKANGDKGVNVDLVGNKIEITATANEIARGVVAWKGSNITLGSEVDTQNINITVTGSNDDQTYGILAYHKNSEINVKTNTLKIKTTGFGIGVSTGYEDLTSEQAVIDVKAENIFIDGTDDKAVGLSAMSSGKLNLEGNVEINAADVLLTRGGAVTNINISEGNEYNTVLNGDVNFDFSESNSDSKVNAKVNINLNGEASSWTGNTKVSWEINEEDSKYTSNEDLANKLVVKDFTLNILKGAQWTPTVVKESGVVGTDFEGVQYTALNKLVLKDGIVDLTGDGTATVETVNGSAGTFKVNDIVAHQFVAKEHADALVVTVEGSAEVADLIAAGTTIEEVAMTVTDGEATIADVVKVEEGLVGGAVTAEINKDGEVVAGSVKQAVNQKAAKVSEAGMNLKAHWRAHMNDMNKRMGELRMANGEAGVWTRMVRGENEYQGAKSQYNQYQLGYDEKLSVDKRWTVGAAVTFAEGDGSYGQGSTEDKSTAFAIYGSKLNNDGTFVDLIARYAHMESDLEDSVYGNGDYSTNGMSVSAEFGKRIQQGNGLWIEPQVELTYGTVDSADVLIGGKYKAHMDSMDSLVGRVGFSIGKDVKQGNVYARASYLYDFDGETTHTFGTATAVGAPIEEDFGGGWWEVGVGANINLSKATYIYADVEKTFGGEVDTNWQWNLGVRYSF